MSIKNKKERKERDRFSVFRFFPLLLSFFTIYRLRAIAAQENLSGLFRQESLSCACPFQRFARCVLSASLAITADASALLMESAGWNLPSLLPVRIPASQSLYTALPASLVEDTSGNSS